MTTKTHQVNVGRLFNALKIPDQTIDLVDGKLLFYRAYVKLSESKN